MAEARDQDLLSYLDKFHAEGRRAQDDTDLSKTDDSLRLMRGQQWPDNLPKGFVDFVLNLINDIVSRKTALLTDARPVIQIVSTNKELTYQPKLIEQCLRSLWDDVAWSEELPKGLALEQISGSIVGMMTYDPLAAYGQGDLRPQILDSRCVAVDPSIAWPTQLPHAEFVITEHARSIASLVEEFGERAMDILPDADISTIPENLHSTQQGILSAAWGAFRRSRRRPKMVPSAIPRAWLKHYWFKDYQRYPDDEPMAGQPVYTKPRIIRHVIGAAGVVLRDEPNPFWHGGYPHEILDWGMEVEHLWGQSEVQQIRKAQEALNRVASDMLKNTILMNNFRVVADKQALDAEEWDKLSNRPAILIQKRQGTELRFESPPALPGYLFQLLEWLVRGMEMTAGLSEVTRGARGGAQSALMLEGLQLAAQTVVRLQARRLENWISRLWDKAISGLFQFYQADRVKSIVGAGNELDTFIFEHAAFHLGITNPRMAFRDFVLHVQPGSMLNATKVQKAVLSGNLHKMGLLPGKAVLQAVEWPNPEGVLAEAREEQAHVAAARGPQGNLGGRGKRQLQSFPASVS